MTFQKTKLSSAVLCAVSGATLGLYTAPVLAQDNPEEAQVIEEILVTGSRIRRPDLDSASPVTVLDAEDFAITGVSDIGSLLQRLPSAAGSPIGTTTNNGGDGSVQIDLRGMGPSRTLTLVNGKRTVDGGDYQAIPANMIERVEILKDGASAVYGADAVAGVVNIITRSDLDGVELDILTSDWFESDAGQQNTISLTAGKTFDGGNIVFGLEYVDQEAAYQRDTPWEFMQDSYYIYPEGCENTLTEPYPTGCYPIGSSAIPEGRFSFMDVDNLFLVGDVASDGGVGLLEDHDGRTYNYAPVNYLQTPYERTNVFMTAAFDVADSVTFKTEVRGNARTSAQELAPLPYFSSTNPAYDGSYNGEAYHGISEENYYLQAAIDAYNTANGTSLDYTPVTEFRRRMIETNRRFTQDVKQFQVDFSLEGETNGMYWDAYANRGYQSNTFLDYGQFSGIALQNALGPSADLDGDGVPECYTDVSDASTLIEGCVPLNLFGGGDVTRATGVVNATTVTDEMIDYVSADLVDTLTAEQTQVGASISGSAFELQGGELGWAVGVSYREEVGEYVPDSQKAAGLVTGNTGDGTTGSITNTSVFGELYAPVWDNGEQVLTVKAGLRYDDFDLFDGDTTGQLGVEFNAIEGVKFRATAGTVFRAPSLYTLYGGVSDSFPTVSDPCAVADVADLAAGCDQVGVQDDSQVLARVGGNTELTPETGDTFTAGVVLTPDLGAHNLTATIDYWEINLEDGIGTFGVQNILTQCYVNLIDSACELVERSTDGDYSIVQVFDQALNVSEQGAKGIDVELKWSTETDFGFLDAELLWTHALERTRVAYEGAEEEDLSGRYTDPTAADGGARPTNKINYSFGWESDFGLAVTYMGEFIGSMDADTFCNCGEGNQPDGSYIQDIESVIYHDLVGSYALTDGLSLTLGVTNVTNEPPPFIEVGFNATTDPATYRLFGRGYYLRMKWDM